MYSWTVHDILLDFTPDNDVIRKKKKENSSKPWSDWYESRIYCTNTVMIFKGSTKIVYFCLKDRNLCNLFAAFTSAGVKQGIHLIFSMTILSFFFMTDDSLLKKWCPYTYHFQLIINARRSAHTDGYIWDFIEFYVIWVYKKNSTIANPWGNLFISIFSQVSQRVKINFLKIKINTQMLTLQSIYLSWRLCRAYKIDKYSRISYLLLKYGKCILSGFDSFIS